MTTGEHRHCFCSQDAARNPMCCTCKVIITLEWTCLPPPPLIVPVAFVEVH